MKKNSIKSQSEVLRQRAEEILKKKPLKSALQLSDVEKLKLIHELEVHQIELEMQNEELIYAREQIGLSSERYIKLYDYAPSGYLTITKEGVIIELNLMVANMLGKERSRLINKLFGLFVSDDTKPYYNLFLDKVFISKTKESCDLTLSSDGNQPIFVHVSGITTENSEQCLLTLVDISERKQTEIALENSKNHYLLLTESIKDVVWTLDTETMCFLYISPSVEKLRGYSVEEILSEPVSRSFTAEASEYMINLIQSRAANLRSKKEPPEKYYTDQVVQPCKNGSLVWTEWVSSYYFNPKSGHVEVRVVTRDITERLKAENVLHDIIEKNPMSIQIVDKDGFTLHANPAHTLLFGAVPPSGFSIFDDLQNRDPRLKKYILLAKKGQVVHLPDLYYNAHDVFPESLNNPLWISVVIFPLTDIDGKPERFVLMHENITEYKLAEAALKESEAKYRLLADNMTDTIWLMDMNLKFIYISPSVEKIRGYSFAELQQFSLDQVLTPSSFKLAMEAFAVEIPKILADPDYSPVHTLDLEFYKRDGDIHSIETKLSIIRDENGNPTSILGQDRDVTERKKAELALKKKSEELEYINSNFIGRELKMIELKKEINDLLIKFGGKEKYVIHN